MRNAEGLVLTDRDSGIDQESQHFLRTFSESRLFSSECSAFSSDACSRLEALSFFADLSVFLCRSRSPSMNSDIPFTSSPAFKQNIPTRIFSKMSFDFFASLLLFDFHVLLIPMSSSGRIQLVRSWQKSSGLEKVHINSGKASLVSKVCSAYIAAGLLLEITEAVYI